MSLYHHPVAQAATSARSLVRSFLTDHGDALATAAESLGGQRAFGRYCRLVESLRRGTLTERALLRELTYFRDLLHLEHLGDPDHEIGPAALLDPWSAEVEDLCRLADAVDDLLDRVRDAQSARPRRAA